MIFFTSALRCTICLCLTFCCLHVAFFSWDKYVKRPTTTKVSQVSLQSDDVPSFAICPQPSVNVNVLKHLIGFNVSVLDQSTICKMDGCDGLNIFGGFVEANQTESQMIGKFYEDLKFSGFNVIHDVMVQLTNSRIVSIQDENSTAYMQPLYEMGDCPVFTVPSGLGDTSKIV